MRNLIMAGLMATSLLPAAAQAQWIDRGEARELRGDRRDIYEERRDLERAYRYGDRRDIRDARDDYRDARREYAQDYRDAYRDRSRGGWYAPRHIYHSRYYVNDWNRYGYAQPIGYQRWVRHGRDALLIDIRNGYVIRVHRNRYW